MKRNIQESFDTITRILGLVGEFDDLVIKETRNLHIQALNLKIDAAKIREPNGVSVIATRLQSTVDTLNAEVVSLITQHRAELLEALKEIQEYIKQTSQ